MENACNLIVTNDAQKQKSALDSLNGYRQGQLALIHIANKARLANCPSLHHQTSQNVFNLRSARPIDLQRCCTDACKWRSTSTPSGPNPSTPIYTYNTAMPTTFVTGFCVVNALLSNSFRFYIVAVAGITLYMNSHHHRDIKQCPTLFAKMWEEILSTWIFRYRRRCQPLISNSTKRASLQEIALFRVCWW